MTGVGPTSNGCMTPLARITLCHVCFTWTRRLHISMRLWWLLYRLGASVVSARASRSTRRKLRQYQDTYAQAMAGFGLKRGVVAGDCTNIFRRHTLAQTHSHERAPCHMRCQQLILRTHLPRLGASPLLFWYPVSRHTSELADLFEMRIVFLIGYSRKGTRIIFIRSLWIFTYKFPYNQG